MKIIKDKSDRIFIIYYLIFAVISIALQIILSSLYFYADTYLLMTFELLLLIFTFVFLLIIKKTDESRKAKLILFVESVILLTSIALLLSRVCITYEVLRDTNDFMTSFVRQIVTSFITRFLIMIVLFITCYKYNMWNKMIQFLGINKGDNKKIILFFVIMFIATLGNKIVETGFGAGWSAWVQFLVDALMHFLSYLPGIVFYLLYKKAQGIKRIRLYSILVILISIPYFYQFFVEVIWGLFSIGDILNKRGILGVLTLALSFSSLVTFAVIFVKCSSFGKILLGIMPKSTIINYLKDKKENE